MAKQFLCAEEARRSGKTSVDLVANAIRDSNTTSAVPAHAMVHHSIKILSRMLLNPEPLATDIFEKLKPPPPEH